MPKDFEDKDMGWDELMKEVLTRKRKPRFVEVGFFTEEVATYAAVNEFGSPSNNIPERPFVRSTFEANESKYEGMLRAAVARAIDKKSVFAMTPVGNEVRNDLVEAIIEWADPPNAESTAKDKGFNNPLVKTGQMQRAIEIHVLRGAGDETGE